MDGEVVELPDGLFMIYQGNDDSGTRSKLGLARSQDGVSWVRVGTAPFFVGLRLNFDLMWQFHGCAWARRRSSRMASPVLGTVAGQRAPS
ncbi:MAG: hypothetical protein HYV07_12755 [Deltaproteobacteria bacterium]|nr:hypothetical protein [Deltaproteobacteria bacterium]